MEALKPLSRCPRLSDLAFANLDTVADWLESIGLPEYLEVFQHNGFTTLQRVRMLWEVELTSVSLLKLLPCQPCRAGGGVSKSFFNFAVYLIGFCRVLFCLSGFGSKLAWSSKENVGVSNGATKRIRKQT